MRKQTELDECLELIDNINKIDKIKSYLSCKNNGKYFQLLLDINYYQIKSLNTICEKVISFTGSSLPINNNNQ